MTLRHFLRRHWKWTIGTAISLLAAAGILLDYWIVLLVLAPIGVTELVVGWRWITRKKLVPIRRSWLVSVWVFLLAYGAFALLPVTGCQHSLQGYDAHVPRNWLGLGRLADWRYGVAPHRERNANLVVVTLDPLPSPLTARVLFDRRRDIMDLLERLHRAKASAAALDFYFPVDTKADGMLASTVKRLRDAEDPFEVFVGAGFEWLESTGELKRVDNPPTLVGPSVDPQGKGCFEEEHHGHLVVFRERDGFVRSVPLTFADHKDMPALSLRVVKYLHSLSETPTPEDFLPPGDLLHLVPPDGDITHLHVTASSTSSTDPAQEHFRVLLDGSRVPIDRAEADKHVKDSVVLLGVHSKKDRFRTPFQAEPLPGVMLHAYAVEALLEGHYIKRIGWIWGLLALILPCLSLAGRFSDGDGWLRLLFSTLASQGALLLVALLAMAMDMTWVDTVYAILGLWLYFGIASAMRCTQVCRAKAKESAAKA